MRTSPSEGLNKPPKTRNNSSKRYLCLLWCHVLQTKPRSVVAVFFAITSQGVRSAGSYSECNLVAFQTTQFRRWNASDGVRHNRIGFYFLCAASPLNLARETGPGETADFWFEKHPSAPLWRHHLKFGLFSGDKGLQGNPVKLCSFAFWSLRAVLTKFIQVVLVCCLKFTCCFGQIHSRPETRPTKLAIILLRLTAYSPQFLFHLANILTSSPTTHVHFLIHRKKRGFYTSHSQVLFLEMKLQRNLMKNMLKMWVVWYKGLWDKWRERLSYAMVHFQHSSDQVCSLKQAQSNWTPSSFLSVLWFFWGGGICSFNKWA